MQISAFVLCKSTVRATSEEPENTASLAKDRPKSTTALKAWLAALTTALGMRVRSPPDLPGVQEVRGGPRMRDPAVANPSRRAHCHKGR